MLLIFISTQSSPIILRIKEGYEQLWSLQISYFFWDKKLSGKKEFESTPHVSDMDVRR